MKIQEPKMVKADDLEERVLEIKRVSKKTKGGNTIAFTALVVIGNRNGKIGSGYSKAKDVSTAVTKAVSNAKRSMVNVKIKNSSIAHEVTDKYASARILLMPAPEGSGIIAGGVARTVLELAGVKNVSSKTLGSSNKICNVRATIRALTKLKG